MMSTATVRNDQISNELERNRKLKSRRSNATSWIVLQRNWCRPYMDGYFCLSLKVAKIRTCFFFSVCQTFFCFVMRDIYQCSIFFIRFFLILCFFPVHPITAKQALVQNLFSGFNQTYFMGKFLYEVTKMTAQFRELFCNQLRQKKTNPKVPCIEHKIYFQHIYSNSIVNIH